VSVAEQLGVVRGRIVAAAVAAGRDPASVRLVAVSKTKPAAMIREAYAQGQRDFGENYAQELESKAQELADLEGICWHFIGHLQTNKAKFVARHAHVIHTLDRPELVNELGKRIQGLGRPPMRALIEVNAGIEAQKAGVQREQLGALVELVRAHPAFVLEGLMTMPPPDDLDAARGVFEGLAALRDAHGGPLALPELSMGMTGDLEIAVAAGATMVRVGSAIFGER
jgi:pyridoxal phosphate enzyme (YggS family)